MEVNEAGRETHHTVRRKGWSEIKESIPRPASFWGFSVSVAEKSSFWNCVHHKHTTRDQRNTGQYQLKDQELTGTCDGSRALPRARTHVSRR